VASPRLPFRVMFATTILALVLATGDADAPEIDQAPAACPTTGDVVAVFTRKREIWLCRHGSEVGRIPVALGRGGNGKKRSGDHRTPLGIYAFGTPRPSKQYGTFIPIAYPTPEQASNGHSGSALGIHGPPRGQAEPEYPATAVDWTLGCVATGTDSDVETVAEFVRRYQATLLVR
jgi:murein L,D-transpeptidase YafK